MARKTLKKSRPRPAEPTTAVLGQAIRERRKQLGLTQAALARFAGCGLAFLYELENGKTTVRLDKLLAVLQVLGLTLRLEPGREPLTIGNAK
ncbi:MAG: helix-turn-helix transcriptional regulator [Polyangiaceae bacterium]